MVPFCYSVGWTVYCATLVRTEFLTAGVYLSRGSVSFEQIPTIMACEPCFAIFARVIAYGLLRVVIATDL